LPNKAFGMGSIGLIEHRLPGSQDRAGLAVVNGGRGQQAQSPAVMVVVVPLEEPAAELQGVSEAAEAVGEFRPVLQRLELALGERVVVRDVGAAVGPGRLRHIGQIGVNG